MAVHEIEPDRWREFLDQFSRDYRAWLTTVERVSPVGPTLVEATDEPLGSVSTDISSSQPAAIPIELHVKFLSNAQMIRVQFPQRVCVDEDDGNVRSLEISDVNSVITRVHFSVPAPPAMLDGIVPAELL